MTSAEPTFGRRELLRRGATLAGAGLVAGALDTGPATADRLRAPRRPDERAAARLGALESAHHARLGVYAVDHRTGATVAHRPDERFAFCSTIKTVTAGCVLRKAHGSTAYLNRVVHYSKADIIPGDFVTGLYLDTGMTIRGLLAAMLMNSDNVAANLLMAEVGGPPAVTRFARSLGDRVTRSDRTEPTLNSAIPGDPRDTTTPRAYAATYSKLLLGNALRPADRALLRVWTEGDDVNLARFRAGLPIDWLIADKTGTGDYGVANDAGVVWRPDGTPLTIVVLTTTATGDRKRDNDDALVAAAARIVAESIGGVRPAGRAVRAAAPSRR